MLGGWVQCFVFVVKYCRCYIWNLVIIIAVKYYAGILLRFWDNTSLVLRLSYNIGSLYIPDPALTCPHMTEVNHLQCRWWCAGSLSKKMPPYPGSTSTMSVTCLSVKTLAFKRTLRSVLRTTSRQRTFRSSLSFLTFSCGWFRGSQSQKCWGMLLYPKLILGFFFSLYCLLRTQPPPM